MQPPNVRRSGRFVETVVGGEAVRVFIPDPLPPKPPLDLVGLMPRLAAAERALGRLDGVSLLLPNKELFLYMYVRKEAVLSSQIEGTQSSLSDLLRFEGEALGGEPVDDVREVSNYVDAMMFGLERLADLPISLRLLREVHGRLLGGDRGSTKNPGEFRRSQNWIGGTRPGNAVFVPPPPHDVMPALDALEKFLHADHPGIPPLIKAGLVHVQFESIHPFLDGNGRLGRLLITLYLCAQGVLQQPLLYLSLFFRAHRADYYRLLQEVRERGAWEAWLEFFLDGVAQTADAAFFAAAKITELFKTDRERIVAAAGRASSVLQVHDIMRTSPFVTATTAVKRCGLSVPTVNAALAVLQALGIVEEVTGRKRGRVYAYQAYLGILGDGAQPAR